MKKKEDKNKKKVKPFDAWVEENIERLAHKPGIQKLFGIKNDKINDLVDKTFKEEQRTKDTYLAKYVKQIPYILLVSGFGIIIFTIIDVLNSTSFGLYWYLSIIIFIGFIVLYIILLKEQKKI